MGKASGASDFARAASDFQEAQARQSEPENLEINRKLLLSHQGRNCETKPISVLFSTNGKLFGRFAVTECGYWGARF